MLNPAYEQRVASLTKLEIMPRRNRAVSESLCWFASSVLEGIEAGTFIG